MLSPHARRGFIGRPRLRVILLIVLASVTSYYLLFSGPSPHFNIVPYLPEQPETQGTHPNPPASQAPLDDNSNDAPVKDEDDGSVQDGKPVADEKPHDDGPKEDETRPSDADKEQEKEQENEQEKEQEKEPEKPLNMDLETYNKEIEMLEAWDLNIEDLRQWKDPSDKEDPNDVAPGYETDGKGRDSGTISRLQHEKDMRKMWRYAYKTTANLESSNKIYGNTLSTLDYKENRTAALREKLREDPEADVGFSVDKPVRFNPYPDYNSDEWKKLKRASYVPCKGPTGEFVEDLLVFKGRPHNFPEPKFGSYSLLNMDPNLCWERDTRLGPYGLLEQTKKVGGEVEIIDWENVNWGDLQRRCVESNAARFDMTKDKKNEYLDVYPGLGKPAAPKNDDEKVEAAADAKKESPTETSKSDDKTPKIKGRSPAGSDTETESSQFVKEKRSAILLRSYTGKVYSKNDRETMRAMISELSLKSGGEFEIFLLVQVKDKKLQIFDDPEVYQSVLQKHIPPEFHDITVLWNDQQVWDIYTELKDDNERSVHTAQWLCVQKFSLDHPEFDYIWNWEMDFRFTGHHYDMLDNLAKFATKQPRRGSWERNERWYIPEYHGDYDTTFRKEVEETYGGETVWGAPDLPFIKPVGPTPPVKTPEEDNYSWGVGEEADFIALSPIFNPVNSNWIIRDNVWGYSDETHRARDLPRRTTIVTHSRLSKRLIDIMHVENLRGNHVASEMTPQTVALLHGFKTIYAPHPIFTDRDWNGKFLNQWFNPGPKGESGGYGSPMGWGRERRFQGNSWYYRAEPPNRMYNNWMGWIDTGIGGEEWEQQNGRPCLPSILLHPVKDTKATKEGHKTGFELFYG
ncbi:major facilitator superfamily transporter [Trichoderma arundinaceum]|uniref:Major facilitator superfamily transporter n=1 Tax=Trichoderma arundinaceum TaxID=490622 RepID=A0A395N9J1_TRIAR|nr:major facilitator superfamily transporter [Trichoderma arundinaceum]